MGAAEYLEAGHYLRRPQATVYPPPSFERHMTSGTQGEGANYQASAMPRTLMTQLPGLGYEPSGTTTRQLARLRLAPRRSLAQGGRIREGMIENTRHPPQLNAAEGIVTRGEGHRPLYKTVRQNPSDDIRGGGAVRGAQTGRPSLQKRTSVHRMLRPQDVAVFHVPRSSRRTSTCDVAN